MSRTILITGATGKFGKAFVQHFLNAGDCVIAAGRSTEALAHLADAHAEANGQLLTIEADLLQERAIDKVIDSLEYLGVKPDCLVNNARNASFLRVAESGLVKRENFLAELTLDVVIPYELVMTVANMQGSVLRAVVNIGSQYGTVAPNLALYDDPKRQSPIHYGVAKAALAHLTKELAVRLANRGVRVNCVAFGGVEGRVDASFRERYAALCPMGRMLRDDEVVGPVDMLLSDTASSITGHTVVADGGWSIW